MINNQTNFTILDTLAYNQKDGDEKKNANHNGFQVAKHNHKKVKFPSSLKRIEL